ncbi:MAG: S8 family serine peptidase [Anaerolineales bacterium]|nr:S8 family serine peptidase [Anaerolineales bacterium]
MQRRLRTQFLLIVLAFFALLTLTSPTRAAAEPTFHVRIAADDVLAAARLELNPVVALDYGAFHWLELDATSYQKLWRSDIAFADVPNAAQLQVMGYQFDPLAGEPAVAADMRAAADVAGFRLVQLQGPANDAWLAALEATGARILQYYPQNSYLVWASPTQTDSLDALEMVRWQGLFHPAYKINSDLVGQGSRIRNVDIVFYDDQNVDSTLDALTALGANILNVFPSQPDKAFYDAIVELDYARVEDVARLNNVLWLGFSGPKPILDDEMSDQIVAGNHPGNMPVVGYNDHLAALGYDGTGVTWAVIDTGIDYAHPDLNTHIGGGVNYPGAPNDPLKPGDDCAGGGHGTHVAGIIGGDAAAGFADGAGFLYGLGIAPGVTFFASNSLCAPSWPPAGGWQEHSKQAVLGDAIGGNNSWTTGEGTQHGYQASERTHDIMVLDGNFDTTDFAEPFIEVFSAGNSGGSGLTAPKEAKNLIVTAASLNGRAGNIDAIASFSSRGPAVDGRVVPTITAPGQSIASSRRLGAASQCNLSIAGTNDHYALCSGTSMAAPHTAGAIVLVTEWWRGFHGGISPSPAMAKALLVNTAVDMGTADIPNNNEGWGRINTTNIISPTTSFLYLDNQAVFTDTGQIIALGVTVLDTSQPFKVTLAWSDAPGAIGANPALVNNLDLTVEIGGEIYLGNVFSGGWSVPGGVADSINNLENVYVQTPAVEATIIVQATNIAGDAVLYNADMTDQSYSLVCNNCAFFIPVSFQHLPIMRTP